MKFSKTKIKKQFLIMFLIINFFGCALSVGTVYAKTESSSHNCSHSENNKMPDVDSHHLLSQPQANEILDLILPETAFNLDTVLTTATYLNTREIINNQGAPPLFEPLKFGVINTKIW